MKTGKYYRTLMMTMTMAAGIAGWAGTASAQEAQLLYPDHIYASSTLPAGSVSNYVPGNVYDWNVATAWTEGQADNGVGEYIGFVIPAGTVITGAKVYTGYGKSSTSFYENSAPTYMIFSSGDNSCGQWMSSYAQNYDPYSDGFYFNLSTPIFSDGVVKVSVGDVRQGSVYSDTCISELHLYGYPADRSMTIDLTGGGYGNGDEDVQELDEEVQGNMIACAERVVKQRAGRLQDITIHADELSSYDRAMILYWYQYNCADERISEYNDSTYGYIHTAAIADLEDIMEELCGQLESIDEDMQIFLNQFTLRHDNINASMYASGDFGDAGEWYFDEADYVENDGDTIWIVGEIMRYDVYSGDYSSAGSYTAQFEAEPAGYSGYHDIYTFREVQTAVYDTDENGYDGSWHNEYSNDSGYDGSWNTQYSNDGLPYDDGDEDDDDDTWYGEGDWDDNEIYDEEELGLMAQEYYAAKTGYTPSCIGTMTQPDGMVVIQLYDQLDGHNSTSAWYQVDHSGIGENVITGEYVDLNEF